MSSQARWVPAASAVGIAFFSLPAIFQAPSWEATYTPSPVVGLALVLFLLVFAVAMVITVRLAVLPAAAAVPEAKRDQLRASSYAFAVAPSVYGLVVALFTSQGLLVLPFSAIAVIGWFVVWGYLREAGRSGESQSG